MNTQTSRAQHFRLLHKPGDPIVLVNIWDAGSAKRVTDQGFAAIATSSHSVAEAVGYRDGQNMPLDELLQVVRQISRSVDKPLTVDFEAGFSDDPELVGKNVTRLISAGAIGINLEDGLVDGGRRLAPASAHAEKISACRSSAESAGVPLFVNARIDTFLLAKDVSSELVGETLERAALYRDAGADGIFVPGLTEPDWIREFVRECGLPVNIMLNRKATSVGALADLGVSRVSLAVWPFEFAYGQLSSALKAFDTTRDLQSFPTGS